MANLPWLDEVLGRLAKRGLPPNYVQRFAEELSDHLEDITEETMSTEANVLSRLGEPNQVAEAAVTAYRRRSFLGRHPTAAFLVFGLSPIVLLVALFALVLVGMLAFKEVCERLGGDMGYLLRKLRQFEPVTSAVMPYVLSLLTVVIPTVLASILYCKLAKRLGIGKKWILLSCVALAATALFPIWSVKFSDLPGQSALRLGTWNPQSIWQLPHFIIGSFCNPQQLLQFLIPLAIGWWFLRRTRDQGWLQWAS